jgi:pyruvate/2-oxoglutarate dehydrogenase complex dihydrolipoamide acyltransferase (E2) component
MIEEENQMGLFEIPGAPQLLEVREPAVALPPSSAKPAAKPAPARPALAKPAPAKAASSPAKPAKPAAPARKKTAAPAASAPPTKKISGLVPTGDVRLTANIRQDLHLKLKIASAHGRTTIGEILEELIENHL